MNAGRALFEQVVDRSGRAAWIGPGTVSRALSSVGVAEPEVARAEDFRRALPQLRARMAIYRRSPQLEQRVGAIEALLR